MLKYNIRWRFKFKFFEQGRIFGVPLKVTKQCWTTDNQEQEVTYIYLPPEQEFIYRENGQVLNHILICMQILKKITVTLGASVLLIYRTLAILHSTRYAQLSFL
jgi:hypothetical protein